MASKPAEPKHRGRLQAQGGGTQKGESWAQDSPPTVTEILEKCDSLLGQLTAKERSLREAAFEQLREFILAAGQNGGISADVGVIKKSFPKRPLNDIRVDIDVLKGSTCVPDPVETRGT